jgi:2-methylcitrate dehydratase PrpD
MQTNLSVSFVESLFELSTVGFPDAVVHQAKRCLLDYLGATLAGSKMIGEKGFSVLDHLTNESDGVTVIGNTKKASIEQAILVNGLSSHIAEMDDGVRYGIIHPGAPLFSALLSVAEKEKVCGIDIIRGIIIGYEASVRLAMSIQPDHYNNGFHPTATCGTIGAAMGIASMMGFNLKQMHYTFAAAVVSAFGSLKVIEDTSELKPLNVARASLNGYISTQMGRAGFSGPKDVLGGKAGFFALMTKSYDPKKLFKSENEPYAIELVYQKPYAACRHAHAAIEVSFVIRKLINHETNSIKSIKLKTYASNIGKHDSKEIYGVSSAKMSIPFSIALALVHGNAGIDAFSSENIKDQNIINLLSKIEIESDETLTALVPNKRPAVLEICTYDGNYFTHRIDYPKGEPENPFTDDELMTKFSELALFAGYNSEFSKKIISIINNFEGKNFELYHNLMIQKND